MAKEKKEKGLQKRFRKTVQIDKTIAEQKICELLVLIVNSKWEILDDEKYGN